MKQLIFFHSKKSYQVFELASKHFLSVLITDTETDAQGGILKLYRYGIEQEMVEDLRGPAMTKAMLRV